MRALRTLMLSVATLVVALPTPTRADAAPQATQGGERPQGRSGRWGMTRGEKLYTRGQVKGEVAGQQFSKAKGMFMAAIVSRFNQARSLLSRDPERRAQAAEHGAVASRGRRWGWRYLKQAIKSKVTAPFDRLRGKVAMSTERIRGALFSLSQGLSPRKHPPVGQKQVPAGTPEGGQQMSLRAQLTTGLRAGQVSPDVAAAFIMGDGITPGKGSTISDKDARRLAGVLGHDMKAAEAQWGKHTLRAGSRVLFNVPGMEGITAQGIVLDAGHGKGKGKERRDPLLAVVMQGPEGMIVDATQVSVGQFSKVYSRKQRRSSTKQRPTGGQRPAATKQMVQPYLPGLDP